MEIYISINGVLRNLIQKLNYHYNDGYILAGNIDDDDLFEYGIVEPIQNDNLLESYKFQSKQQFDYFLYIEYVLEIFGHAGLSQDHAISNLNKLMASNQEHNFTLIGLDELGKAKPATLFFLSKNGFMGDNIKFIKTSDIEKTWEKCDYWVTDEKNIIDKCPEGKTVIKFNTPYNQHFTNIKEITNLNEIEETWLKSLEKPITLISTESSTNVE
jgi:hypothetical protein